VLDGVNLPLVILLAIPVLSGVLAWVVVGQAIEPAQCSPAS
jgi:hypothetical protein